MKVALRGTIRASLGLAGVDVEVPPDGLPLSAVLESLADAHPRARAYLGAGSGQAVLRPVHNGTVVPRGADPLVRPEDTLLLIHAVAGGERASPGGETMHTDKGGSSARISSRRSR